MKAEHPECEYFLITFVQKCNTSVIPFYKYPPISITALQIWATSFIPIGLINNQLGVLNIFILATSDTFSSLRKYEIVCVCVSAVNTSRTEKSEIDGSFLDLAKDKPRPV